MENCNILVRIRYSENFQASLVAITDDRYRLMTHRLRVFAAAENRMD